MVFAFHKVHFIPSRKEKREYWVVGGCADADGGDGGLTHSRTRPNYTDAPVSGHVGKVNFVPSWEGVRKACAVGG